MFELVPLFEGDVSKADRGSSRYEFFETLHLRDSGESAAEKIDKYENKYNVPQIPPPPQPPPQAETPIFSDRRVIGTAFDTYILFEQDGSLFIVDQHAAQERVNYEKILAQLKDRKGGQILLTPEIIEFTASEKAEILENVDAFSALGFAVSDFGSGNVMVGQAPAPLDGGSIKSVILEILEKLKTRVSIDAAELMTSVTHSIACKSSVRANDKLNPSEIEKLLDLLDGLGNINTCPHGRPIKISISKTDFEKMFKRIV